MTRRIVVLAALVSVPFVGSVPALAIVPGSDAWTRAQETA